MRVFVAGGSGTIGVPLVRALVEAGHQVTALTRSADKQAAVRDLGRRRRLPTLWTPPRSRLSCRRPGRHMSFTSSRRSRRKGCGVLHGVGQDAARDVRGAVEAVQSMESQILEASRSGRIEGVVLRYGLFYGPDNPATQKMVALVRRRLLPVVRGDSSLLPCIHVAEAVSATVATLDRGRAGSVYDIVDDQPVSMTEIVRVMAAYAGAPPPFTVPAWLPRLFAPYLAGITAMRLPLSNEKARVELGWRPAFPTWRDGLAKMAARAA